METEKSWKKSWKSHGICCVCHFRVLAMAVFQFTGSPYSMYVINLILIWQHLHIVNLKTKLEEWKGIVPLASRAMLTSLFLFQQPMCMTVMCWCGAMLLCQGITEARLHVTLDLYSAYPGRLWSMHGEWVMCLNHWFVGLLNSDMLELNCRFTLL